MHKLGKLIAVEGPDGCGKDTFVKGLFCYLDSYYSWRESKDPNEFLFMPKLTLENIQNCPFDTEYERFDLKARTRNKIKFINLYEGSPYSREFITKIHSGEISDPVEIAKGYLELHYHYWLAVLVALSQNDLVIMNRSLMSYDALQLRTLGLNVAEEFDRLVRLTNIKNVPHYVLLPKKEIIVERASAKNVSKLDDFFTKRIGKVFMAYHDITWGIEGPGDHPDSLPWNATRIDTTEVLNYIPFYKEIVWTGN